MSDSLFLNEVISNLCEQRAPMIALQDEKVYYKSISFSTSLLDCDLRFNSSSSVLSSACCTLEMIITLPKDSWDALLRTAVLAGLLDSASSSEESEA